MQPQILNPTSYWFIHKLFIHYLYIIFTLFIHYSTLFLHYLCIIYTLSIHYFYTIYTLFIHHFYIIYTLLYIICTLFIHYLYIIYTLFIHYFYTIYTLFIHYLYTIYKLYVSTKTFHLPAAHWAAVSQFSMHVHIVEKKVFKNSFSQNMLFFKVRQVKKKTLKTYKLLIPVYKKKESNQKTIKS